MITGELKHKVDRLWDAFWAGGIANPLEVIEQITYLIFIRRLDDLQTAKENRASPNRQADRAPDLRGRRRAKAALVAVQERAPRQHARDRPGRRLPWLRSLGGDGSTYAHHMKDARFTIPTAEPAGQGRRPDRPHPARRAGHQRRPLRVHAGQDRHGRAERAVPDAAAHHPAHGRDDGARSAGRDLRPGMRDGGIPDGGGPVLSRDTCGCSARSRASASTSTTACSMASTSTAPCCASPA